MQNEKRSSSNHRGNFDIIADILNASFDGAKKTHLMYHCNLSFRQLKFYSYFLLDKGFLRTENDGFGSKPALFEITEKGKEFLKAYKGLIALMQ